MVKRQIKWTPRALEDRTKSVDYSLKLEQLFSATLSLLASHPGAGKFFDKKRYIRFAVVKIIDEDWPSFYDESFGYKAPEKKLLVIF